jgi:hypothetical protein
MLDTDESSGSVTFFNEFLMKCTKGNAPKLKII